MHPHDAPPASTGADALDALAGLLLIGALFLALAGLSWAFNAPPGDYGPIPAANAEP